MHELITPERLYSRQEILSKPSPIPEISGVYGWFFKDVPPFVLTEGCIRHQNMTLLYIGISPDKKKQTSEQAAFKKTNHQPLCRECRRVDPAEVFRYSSDPGKPLPFKKSWIRETDDIHP